MPNPASFLQKYLIGTSLSRNSYFLLFAAGMTSRFFDFENTSTVLMMLFSVVVGEYFTLPHAPQPEVKSNQRPLGFTESILHNRYSAAEGASNVGAIMQVTGTLDVGKIKDVLHHLLLKHPLLRAKIMGPDKAASLQLADRPTSSSLPLTTCTRTSDTFSKDLLEEKIDAPFPEKTLYLWEIILAKNNDENGPHEFILKAHHCIFDGISLATFMEEFLSCYNQDKKLNPALPFLKPEEDLVRERTNWTRFLLKSMIEPIWEACFGKKIPTEYRPHPCGTTLFSKRNTKLSFADFSSADLQNLIRICRENHTTVTAIMTAALLQATRETFGRLAIETISTPISVRPNFGKQVPAGDHLGCYIADTKVKLPITEDMTIWDIAKQYKEKLVNCMPVIYPANFAPSLWKVEIIGQATLTNRPFFSSGIGVSNLGNRNFMSKENSDTSLLKFQRLYYCASKRSGGKVIAVYTVTAQDKLFLCFSHPDPLVTRTQADRVKEKTLDILKSIMSYQLRESSGITSDTQPSKEIDRISGQVGHSLRSPCK